MIITPADLKTWANVAASNYKLPRLIRKLAYATLVNPLKINFPSDESTSSPDWDGEVETEYSSQFVPSGHSFWEMGVEKNPTSKANSDYKKRTDSSEELDLSSKTFVFVTPRKWNNKKKWEIGKRKEKKWKNVVALDCDDLVNWLERAPSVACWLNNEMGRSCNGVKRLDQFWEEWRTATKPPLTSELVLSRPQKQNNLPHIQSRKRQEDELYRFLMEPSGSIGIIAETENEATAFIAATIETSDVAFKERVFSQALIVEKDISWQEWKVHPEHLILIANQSIVEDISFPSQHHIIVLLQHTQDFTPSIYLNPLETENVIEWLVRNDIKSNHARRIARETEGSLEALRWELRDKSILSTPSWASRDEGTALTPFLLIGKWHENNPNDRRILELISGKDYQTLSTALIRWEKVPNSPLLRNGTRWKIKYRAYTWRKLEHFVSHEMFVEFSNQSLQVLGEIDTKYNLPNEDRMFATLHGIKLTYSKEIRSGIAETWALIGSIGRKECAMYGHALPKVHANSFLTHLFQHQTPDLLWESISDLLPILAEADPDRFLEIVERDLDLNPSPILSIFLKEHLWGGVPHAGLLWALECIAWKPDYLGRVASLLVKLSRNDPGGKLFNRPFHSLHSLFRPWRPYTTATLDQRLRVLESVLILDVNVGIKLLIGMLPRIMGDIANENYFPHWRNWADEWEEITSQKDNYEVISYCFDKILSAIPNSAALWNELLERFTAIPPELQGKLLRRLHEHISKGFNEDDKEILRKNIGELISHHLTYPGQPWNFKDNIVSDLKNAYDSLKPSSLFERYRIYFESFPRIPEIADSDWETREQKLTEIRSNAVSDLLRSENSVSTHLDFVRTLQDVRHYGFALGNSELPDSMEREFIWSVLSKPQKDLVEFIRSFILGRFTKRGPVWLSSITQDIVNAEWSDYSKSIFLTSLPHWESEKLFHYFSIDIQTNYWELVPINHFYLIDPSLLQPILLSLLNVSRHFSVLDLLTNPRHTISSIPSGTVLLKDTLLGIMRGECKESRNVINTMQSYEVCIAMKTLSSTDVLTDIEQEQLEWFFYSCFEQSDYQPVALYNALQNDPQRFIDYLSLIYVPEYETNVSDSTEQEKQTAFQALDVLENWNIIPGTNKNGTIDKTFLIDWISRAKSMCAVAGLSIPGQEHIGRILSKSITDTRYEWPCIPVCEAIQVTYTETIASGFYLGVRSSRNAYWLSRGVEEKNMASTYRDLAEKTQDRWPRVAGILRKVVLAYEADAQRDYDEQ